MGGWEAGEGGGRGEVWVGEVKNILDRGKVETLS